MKSECTYATNQVSSLPRKLLLAFMLTTLIAPVSILNKILFVILMIWTLSFIMKSSKPRLCISAFTIITIFFYGLLIGIFERSDGALALQFFMATFVLILIHFIDNFRIDMDQAAELCGKVMLAVTVVYLVVAFNQDLPYAATVFNWLNNINSSASSERDFFEGGLTLTLALGTAPFLFVPWCIVSVRLIRTGRITDFLWLLSYGLAIGLSGSRGLVVVALIFLIAALLWLTSLRMRVIVFLILVVVLLMAIPSLLNETKIFSGEEISNATKMGHLNSFVDQLNSYNFFIGNGLGSYYFSSGKDDWLAHTELTPVDLARYVGVPLAFVVYFLMLFPFARIACYRGQNFLFVFGFFLFLILSVTNPTLINSYGMLVVIWYWARLGRSFKNYPSESSRKSFSKNVQPFSGLQG